MGNEGSQLNGLELDEKPVEVTDNWTLYSASVGGASPPLSVFVGQSGGQFQANNPLQQLAKRLMIYRHPCIVRYIRTWYKNSCLHLATEEVKPLSQALPKQSTLQICSGLYSVLKALVFLHEKAQVSHNNVCRAAIYIATDGTWKLGGFEFLCSFQELTPAYLQNTRARRYEKAVAPEEDDEKLKIEEPQAIDAYAFGVLVEEVLRKRSDENLEALKDFVSLAKRLLQSSVPSLRPALSTLLGHHFFSQDFIEIKSFLSDLPLKNDKEKDVFFRSLLRRLMEFPEEIVASQLGTLLLSRLVLLNSTAQKYVLPYIVIPVSEQNCGTDLPEDELRPLFSEAIYKEHIVPKLLQIFCVRDAQIRLILLSHFSSYCSHFSVHDLKQNILPELLVGIKDTNDRLVSSTLHALAELVPLLGAATVIGGKRGKLFTDGRPKVINKHTLKKESKVATKKSGVSRSSEGLKSEALDLAVKDSNKTSDPSALKAQPLKEVEDIAESGYSFSMNESRLLPERPSPDGGEDEDKTDDDAWSDWEEPTASETANVSVEGDVSSVAQSSVSQTSKAATKTSVSSIMDILSLDIKVSQTEEEIDFFQDMEPVISKTNIVDVSPENNVSVHSTFSVAIEEVEKGTDRNDGKKFQVLVNEKVEEAGWDDDLDWGEGL